MVLGPAGQRGQTAAPSVESVHNIENVPAPTHHLAAPGRTAPVHTVRCKPATRTPALLNGCVGRTSVPVPHRVVGGLDGGRGSAKLQPMTDTMLCRVSGRRWNRSPACCLLVRAEILSTNVSNRYLSYKT